MAISSYIALRLWPIRRSPGAAYLLWAIFCVLVWTTASIFEITSENLALKLLWTKVQYLGIAFLALAIFSFALVYSGRGKWLTRNRFLLLLILPLGTFFIAVSNGWHHLLWSTIGMPPGTLIGPLVVGKGPWYYVNIVYSYILLIISTAYFIHFAYKNRNLYRQQALIMLIGMLIPWVGNILYILRSGPIPGFDWTPLTFTLAIIAFAIGFSRFNLLDLLPVTQALAFSALPDGIIASDVNGRIAEINPAAQKMLSKQGKHLVGKSIKDILPGWEELNTETSTAFEVDHEFVLKDGEYERIYNLRISPILGRYGQINGKMMIFNDITVQKTAQAQVLLQSAALEAAENGIFITDVHGKIQWCNPAFSRLTGYSAQEIVGQNPRILKSETHPDAFYKQLWETIGTGEIWHGEIVNRRKDGTLYNDEMTITPLVQPGGKITNFIAVKQDITKRKGDEESLQKAHQEAVSANRIKTQLLTSVSHDLRTPLGSIMGYADMLQAGQLGEVNPEQRKAASEILDSANRLHIFVNNLIGQAQLETGQVVIRSNVFQPFEVIDGIRSSVGYVAKKKNIAFHTVIQPDLPGNILGDPYWLKQILLNLVNNAFKYTNEGKVDVLLYRSGMDHWVMQVSDTGIGIPEAAKQSIFEPFVQIPGKDSRDGSGLGLSIVKHLVQLMDGKIDLQSKEGQGSTFSVTLPLVIPGA